MADAYVTVEEWAPRKEDFPAAALTSYLYPPQVSVSKMPFSSPRAGEGSPTALRGAVPRSGSIFITEAAGSTNCNSTASSAYQLQRNGKDKTVATPPPSIVPSSYEQQQARCRYWHHEFHRLLVDEVRVVHHKLHHRHTRRQGQSMNASTFGSPSGSVGLMMDPSISNGASGVASSGPAGPGGVPPSSMDAADEDDAYLLGEDSAQQQLLSRLMLTNPLPDAYYGSVLPSAPKASWFAPGVMSLPMAMFLEEFEAACVDGATAVLEHIVSLAQSRGGSLMGSQKASPSNRSVDRGSLMGSPSWIGSTRAGNPNMVRSLEDSRGLDTDNFFVYKHMVFNVLHLMEDDVMALFGCVENAEKAAAAEVRGLEQIVRLATLKGSLTLQSTTAAAGRTASGQTSGGGEGTPASSSNNPSLSVPLVCLVRVHGVSMFVVAQPMSTPSEALIAGPSVDGIHVASTMRHTSLLTSLCASLRVPNAPFFVTPQHQKLMSQCPLLGHPELSVTLATKLSPEYEASIEGRIGALHPYRLPFLPVAKLRSWIANRKPFDSPDMLDDEHDEGGGGGGYAEGLSSNLGGGGGSSQSDAQPPSQHTLELLIVQNVARLVSPAADVAQTTLMPHIVSPLSNKMANQSALIGVPTPPRNTTPREPSAPNHIQIGGAGSKHLVSPRIEHHQQQQPGDGNRYLSIGRGRALTALLHPNFVLTLPYEQEVPRSDFNIPPTSDTTYEDACAAATRGLLQERIPKMLSWLLRLLDNLDDDIGGFVDQFDGEVLKGVLKAWGCNMRYLGFLHGKLCEAIVLRSQTAYAATHLAAQQQAAAKTAALGNGIAATAASAVAAASQSGNVKSSRKLVRQATVQQPPNPSSSPTSSSTAPLANAAVLMRQLALGVGGKSGWTKKYGGALFLNRHTALDAPNVNNSIRETLVGLSGLLSVTLNGDAPVLPPHVPQAPQTTAAGGGGGMLGRRASVMTTGGLSNVSASQQPFSGGGGSSSTTQQPPPPPPPSEAIRRPSDRSPLEHVLLVVRAEMIARCFRVVYAEHLRVISLYQKLGSRADPLELPSITMQPLAVKPKGGTLLALITDAAGATARSPVHEDGNKLFRSPDPKPLDQPAGGGMVARGGAGAKSSTTARLYQKLKDLDAVLDEKNHLSQRRSDVAYTARSLDKIAVMDTVQQQKSSGGVMRPSNPSSVLVDDPHPRFEPDGGIFTTARPDAEREKVSELIALLVQNGSTSVSAQFWRQIMMSELWAKYGNFLSGGAGVVSGASSKREDIQKCDMVVVLMRVGKLCGVEYAQSLKDQVRGQYPAHTLTPPSSRRPGAAEDDAVLHCEEDDTNTTARLGRRSLGKLRITHHSIEAVHARTRSTLRRVERDTTTTTARPSVLPMDPRAEVGRLSSTVPRNALYDEKTKELEDELADLQLTRFVKSGKKFKEGLGDEATVREIAVLDALIRLYSMGGAAKTPHLQLAQAQKENAEVVMFYHSVRRLWHKAEFDGICYRPCGGCGVLYNASLSDVHACGGTTVLAKVDKEELSVGVADGKLPSALITASSFAKGCEPCFARRCVSAAAWRPLDVGHEHYMEFSFSTTREVKAIEMQGDGVERFVRSFQLVYTLDHKDPETFTGVYYRRDENIDASTTASLAGNGGKGERMFARPFVHNNAARDKERIRGRREGSWNSDASATFESRSPTSLDAAAFGSIRWASSMRAQDTASPPNRAGSQRFGNTAREQSFTFSRLSPHDLQSTGRAPPGAEAATTSSTSGLRPTFLKGNTNAKSLVRIQFETPIRCSTLRFIVGNDDASTAALNVDIFYTSRHMPAPGRSGCERIAVNHINWLSPVSLTTFGDPGSMRNLVHHAPHGVDTLKMTRKELASKEKALLERILEIEAEVEDKSPAALARALPHECILIRTSTELQSLWNQLLQLLLMWGMERSSDVQFAQFRLLRYLLGELKLYATCGQLDVAAVRADRLLNKLDDAVGPLGFGGVAMLVGPLMCLIFDALQCAGVAARHIDDFYHMVEWASAVRHPLTVQLVAVLIDAAGYGKAADRERVAQLCEQLASEGRLGDVTKLLAAPPGSENASSSDEGSGDNGFSPAVVAVFRQLCSKEVFMRTSGENANSLYPEESDAVGMREARVNAAM